MRAGIALLVGAALCTTTACAPDPPQAVVRIEVRGCQPGVEVGTGAFVGDGIVLTSAHTLRGVREVTVRRGDTAVPAEVVGFDPDNDLAYLAADLGPYRPFTVDSSQVEAGDTGVAWVARPEGVVPLDVTVVRPIRINTEDVYVDALVERPGFELQADIRPGDSGGPVIVGGRVIGVLWARSRSAELRAYAIDPDRGGDRIERQLTTGTLFDVDLTRCV